MLVFVQQAHSSAHQSTSAEGLQGSTACVRFPTGLSHNQQCQSTSNYQNRCKPGIDWVCNCPQWRSGEDFGDHNDIPFKIRKIFDYFVLRFTLVCGCLSPVSVLTCDTTSIGLRVTGRTRKAGEEREGEKGRIWGGIQCYIQCFIR